MKRKKKLKVVTKPKAKSKPNPKRKRMVGTVAAPFEPAEPELADTEIDPDLESPEETEDVPS